MTRTTILVEKQRDLVHDFNPHEEGFWWYTCSLKAANGDNRVLVRTGYLTIFRHVEKFHITGITEAGHCCCHKRVVLRCHLIL